MRDLCRNHPWHIALGISFLSLAAFSLLPGPRENEERTLQESPLTLSDYLSSRRNYFLGHREFSDLLTGLDIVAASVDMFQNSKVPESEKEKLRGRFENSLENLKGLSRWATGMNDAYTFPSMYLLFEDQDPERANQAIRLGVNDTRTSSQVPLLAAFISHVFLRDPKQAGEYYSIIFNRYPKIPKWINELATRLKAGDDPFDSSPNVRKYILSITRNAFPRARAYFEKNQKLYEERRLGDGKPDSVGERH